MLKVSDRNQMVQDEKYRLRHEVMTSNKLTVLMACAGSIDTLFRIGYINETERLDLFSTIEDRIANLPKETFRL